MRILNRLLAAAPMAALALAAACTPAETDRTDADGTDTRTVVETREVPVPTPPVVVEREVPGPPVVVERDDRDSTTIRAGEDGIEVETRNR